MLRSGGNAVFLHQAPTVTTYQTLSSGRWRDRTAHEPITGPVRRQALPWRSWVSRLTTRVKT